MGTFEFYGLRVESGTVRKRRSASIRRHGRSLHQAAFRTPKFMAPSSTRRLQRFFHCDLRECDCTTALFDHSRWTNIYRSRHRHQCSSGAKPDIRIQDMGTSGTNLIVGPATLVGGVYVDGSGSEQSWTIPLTALPLSLCIYRFTRLWEILLLRLGRPEQSAKETHRHIRLRYLVSAIKILADIRTQRA